jgi:hypothetical protein
MGKKKRLTFCEARKRAWLRFQSTLYDWDKHDPAVERAFIEAWNSGARWHLKLQKLKATPSK